MFPDVNVKKENNILWNKVAQTSHIVFLSVFSTLIKHSYSPKNTEFSV